MSNIGLDGRGVSPPINGGEYGLISDLYIQSTDYLYSVHQVCTSLHSLATACVPLLYEFSRDVCNPLPFFQACLFGACCINKLMDARYVRRSK